MDRLKRRAQKKKKPPKFECNLTKGKSRGKYKIEGVGTLESAQPGSFVWLEIQKFKNVDAEFSIRNQKCGVGYTTQSDKVKVKFALDDPGLYVFSVHVDANDNRKQDEQIDWTGRIVDQATQKPLDVSGKKRSHKGLKFDITPSAATPAAVKTPMPDSPE